MKQLKVANYIDGQWLNNTKNGSLEILNKYDQKLIANFPLSNEDEVEKAIASSVTGYNEIKSWSAGKRSEYLQKLWNTLDARKEEAIDIIVREAGKPRSYAEAEVSRSLSTIKHSVIEAIKFSGEIVPIDFSAGEGKTAFTKRIPIGPVLCITPFNFPLNLVLHKVAPALASGCSVVVKPAPQSPLSAFFLASLLDEVGYPPGVANFLMCEVPLVEKMVRDDRFKMVSFTGSEKIGWHIKNICGMKKVALELGGNAAVIIDEGTDLAQIAKKVANGAYLYAGQICISTQRIYVLESVFKEFKDLLISEIHNLKIGDPGDSSTIVGPLIDKIHLKRIETWVNEAKSSGAQVLVGGEIFSENNCIYSPTLLTQTTPLMKVVAEEAFGPVAIIEKAKSFKEAVDLVNDSKFGLQVGVFTNNLGNFIYGQNTLEVGGIIFNNVPGFRIDNMPYGGIKMSGLGREGIKYVMEEMTEPRLIVF